MQNHNLNRKIQESIDTNNMKQAEPGYGIVVKYNRMENTAMVLLSRPDSDMPGELINDIPCPTVSGVQSVEPEIGKPCWVSLRGGAGSPVITHFFNHNFESLEYNKQYKAKYDIPRFMMEL